MWVEFSFSGCFFFWNENTKETHSTLVGVWQPVSVNTVKQKQVQCMMPVHFWCKLTWQQQGKKYPCWEVLEKYSCRFCLFAYLRTVMCLELLPNDMLMVFLCLQNAAMLKSCITIAGTQICMGVWMKKCSPVVPKNIKLFYRSSTNTEIKCNMVFVCFLNK